MSGKYFDELNRFICMFIIRKDRIRSLYDCSRPVLINSPQVAQRAFRQRYGHGPSLFVEFWGPSQTFFIAMTPIYHVKKQLYQ